MHRYINNPCLHVLVLAYYKYHRPAGHTERGAARPVGCLSITNCLAGSPWPLTTAPLLLSSANSTANSTANRPVAEEAQRGTTSEIDSVRYTVGYSYPDPDRPACALPFAPAHRGNLLLCSALLCSAKRGRDRVLRVPRAPDLFPTPVLSLFFNTPPPPPPLLPSSLSFLLQHLLSISRPQRFRARIGSYLGKPQISQRRGFNWTSFLPARTGQPLIIHPSRQSAPFWSFASARFIACNKRATACRGSTLHKRRLSILLVFVSLRDP